MSDARQIEMDAHYQLTQVVVGNLYAYWEETYLDPGEALEDALANGKSAGELLAARDQLQNVLDRNPTEESLEAKLRWLGAWDYLPVGNSWRAWVEWVLERVTEAAADLSTVRSMASISFDRLYPPRTSRFTDKATADAAVTQVLRAHEGQFTSWCENQQGSTRMHLYADLGTVVGEMKDEVDESVSPVTGVAVVLKVDHVSGNPFVLTAYPEISLPTEARTRWPDLATALGGFFGQDWPALEGSVWQAMDKLQRALSEPARSRVSDQLGELLLLDDAALAEAVHVLGSYVIPPHLRDWLRRMRTWLYQFDWSPRPPEPE